MRGLSLLAALVLMAACVVQAHAADFMKFNFLDGQDRTVEQLKGQTTAVFGFLPRLTRVPVRHIGRDSAVGRSPQRGTITA